jgi:mxaJ protein
MGRVAAARFCAATLLCALTALLVACTSPPRAVALPGRTLRVCADPNNLPFSNQAQEGFENKIAELVARTLGARLEYQWWPQRRGFVRNTLGAGTCELIVGVPSHFEMAATTRPYYRSSYVFVTRTGDAVPASFDDPLLKHLSIGVHLIGDDGANTPPVHALSNRGIIKNVKGFSIYGDYRTPNPPAALVAAVARGDVDVAIAWGPLAGYFIRRQRLDLELTPVSPQFDPPSLPFVFDIAMGVARGNTALLDEMGRFVEEHRRELDAILLEYNVPRVDRARSAAADSATGERPAAATAPPAVNH